MRRVSIYRRKGRGGRLRRGWTVQHYDSRGRRLWLSVDTKDEAQREADRLRRLQRASEGLAEDVQLEDYAEIWFRRAQKTIRPGTAHVYAWAIDNHVIPELGRRRMREVTSAHIKDLLAGKLEDLAKKTVRNIRSTLHALFAEAADDGIVATNPVAFKSKAMKLTPSRAERRAKIKALTAEQLRAFAAATAPAVGPARALQFRIMWSTGLRPGEALALQWRDLDSAGSQLRVARGFTRSQVQPTKSGEERVVDLPRGLAQELEAKDRQTKRQALAAGESRGPWLFPSREGTPGDHKYQAQDFAKVLKAAKLPPHFTPHCLRHTYATLQLISGVSIYYVQQQLGHASIQQTVDHYGSWLPAGNAEHANRLEDQVTGADDEPSATGHGTRKRR